jgi:hypothetical protein
MRFLATAVLALAVTATGVSGNARSGLKGVVLIDPAFPVCKVGEPCTKPAKYVTLVFSRQGRTVVRTKTGADGSYRITLKPGVYAVTSPNRRAGSGLTPRRAAVRTGLYRRVVFRLDIGIR